MPDPAVDRYIEASDQWPEELIMLRPIILKSGLTEQIKWAKPCYTLDGKNVVIVQEMRDFLALMFFKGALLSDPHGLLEDQGPNSRSARRMCFTSPTEVKKRQGAIASYLREAIDVEMAGLAVGEPPELELVEELRIRLDEDDELATAFRALTPGRQREYNIYFSGAKQAKTRVARIEKLAPKILAGRGMRER